MEITRKPGVIQTIVAKLREAGAAGEFVTVEDILVHLSYKFPDRDLEGMEITVRAQLYRLPIQKNIPVVKRRLGRVMGYSSMG